MKIAGSTTVDFFNAVTERVIGLPVEKSQVLIAMPVLEDRKPWLNMLLIYAGREILPQLADTLIAALDRRLAQSQSVAYPLERQAELSLLPNNGRCLRRRSRVRRAHH